MGRADNRRTPKGLRRKAQRRKKMRLKKRIDLGKSKDKKVRARPAVTGATVAPAKPTSARKSSAAKAPETTT